MAYEYKVAKNYHSQEWDFDLVEGDIVADADFPEPDIPANLIGKGILEPADMEAENSRLLIAPKVKKDKREEIDNG